MIGSNDSEHELTQDDELIVEPDDIVAEGATDDDAADATAALRGAGGDGDRAEALLESRRAAAEGDPVPDDDRPIER